MNNTISRIKSEIDSFVEYLPIISTEDEGKFDDAISNFLINIDDLSNELPENRKELQKYCFDNCAHELEKGIIGPRCRQKPAGYAGDYLIIDWLYTKQMETNGEGKLWDEFNHRQAAAKGVRSRKKYFCEVLSNLCQEKTYSPSVLNLASGPCRDVAEAIKELNECAKGIHFHCVDIDKDAIDYGKKMVNNLRSVASFQWEINNVFKLRPFNQYDLVWVAGLFDYLNDRCAISLLKKMISWIKPGGRIIFGNAHPSNPSLNYMEWCLDWSLIHRTTEEILSICEQAGILRTKVSLEKEDQGVWIFANIDVGEAQ